MAAELDRYSERQMAEVTQWIVHVTEGTSSAALATELNVPSLEPAGLLPDSYRFEPEAGADNEAVLGDPDRAALPARDRA